MAKPTGPLPRADLVREIIKAIIEEHGLLDQEARGMLDMVSIGLVLKAPARTASPMAEKVNFSR